MRAAVALVLVTACGRIEIDPLATSDAAAIADVATDTFVPCAAEGMPCDDGNICTDTSTCVSGSCLGAGEPTCTVARSESEYSSTQGQSGWYYGYWEAGTDNDGLYNAKTEFLELADFGGIWRPPSWQDQPSPNFTWAYLHWWGGHPGSSPVLRVPVRRWISDVVGHATAVVFMDSSDTGGDGTRAILVVDGATVFTRDVPDGAPGFEESLPIELAVGTTVDLLLHPIGDDGADTSTMWMNIKSR
jgi:hypothetical protein